MDKRMTTPRIRAWMRKGGLSQRDLARLIGVHETTVSRILAGTRRLGVRPAMRLAREMGVPLEAFFK